jgi:hypothetical protein
MPPTDGTVGRTYKGGFAMKKQNFSIHAPVFDGMRADMDQRLAESVDMIRETGAEKATITVKINVSLETREVVSSDNTLRPAKVPVMDYKISNVVKLTSNSADVVDTGNLEIHKLVEGYELRPAGVDQMSMDDTDEDEELLDALAEA